VVELVLLDMQLHHQFHYLLEFMLLLLDLVVLLELKVRQPMLLMEVIVHLDH
jgi:hypothetical protein